MEYIETTLGLRLPLVGFGTHKLHGQMLCDSVGKAYSMGYRLFDSAWLYKNEADLGRAFSQNNIQVNDCIVTSKLSAMQLYFSIIGQSFCKSNPLKALKKSQKMLGGLDLYLLHSPFKKYDTIYKTLLESIRNTDGSLHFGVCNCGIEHLNNIHDTCGIWPEVNQIEIHPFRQQQSVVNFCQENGIVVEAYSPFGRGAILEELNSNSTMNQLSFEYGKTITQIILRWITQKNIVALPRTRSESHLAENLEIFDFQLSEAEIKQIAELDRGQHYGKEFDKEYT